jgi:CubicO group peptidase (beta-lactamase class C family)
MNRREMLRSSVAVAMLTGGCASGGTRRASPLRRDFDTAVDHAMVSLPSAPGVGVAVYAPEGVYVRGAGVTDVLTRERTTEDTAFYIASSTKSFTALAFAILHGRGELDLHATLTQFAPDAPFPIAARASEVRLRDLLTHTSGIWNDYIAARLAFSGDHDLDTLWNLLELTLHSRRAPLGTFRYTNTGYNIATLLLERTRGVDWRALLQREIFSPLALRRTTTRVSEGDEAGWSIARPHFSNYLDGAHRAREKTDATMQSAGGMFMSPRDAAAWLEFMVNDGLVQGRQIVPTQVVSSTRQPLASVDQQYGGYQRDAYGLGWYVGRYRDDVLVHSFGNFGGANSHISYMPSRRMGVAVFVNDEFASSGVVHALANYFYDRTSGREDARAVFDAALAALTERHEREAQTAEQARRVASARASMLTHPRLAYAGRYENPGFGVMTVSIDETTVNVTWGVAESLAYPTEEPDALQVELVPGSAALMRFEFTDRATPDAFVMLGERFTRTG